MNLQYNCFYKNCIPTAQVMVLLESFEAEEKAEALHQILIIMNYIVWQYICQLLDPKEHDTFFSLQDTNYDDVSLIDWLQERCPEIATLLPEALERGILALIVETTQEPTLV